MSAQYETLPRFGEFVAGIAHSMTYAPPAVPSPLSLPKHDPSIAPMLRAAAEIVYQAALHDPLAVVRSLARALRPQSRGARSMVLRRIVEELAGGDAELTEHLVTDLAANFVKRHLN